MPKEMSDNSADARSESYSDMHWSGIGINAVAAASMCKSYDQHRCEQDAHKNGFPHDETEFATD